MSWGPILGHDRVAERFRECLRRGRLASTFLFIGPAGIGKFTFALRAAQSLLCERHDEALFDPCGRCAACQQVDARTHPDLLLVAKPPDKTEIPVALFIGDKENRMREGLCHDIALRPFRGGRKIAIIDDADDLNEEGANCLLKTLEEPPLDSILILISTSEQRQLPTIRSRCQVMRFEPLSPVEVREILLRQKIADRPDVADELARLSQGSLDLAGEYANPDLREFREQVLQQLANPPWRVTELSQLITGYVDAGGKDAASRRPRLRQTIRFSTEFYRCVMRVLAGEATTADLESADPVQIKAVREFTSDWKWGPAAVGYFLYVCMDCLAYIDANAMPASILDLWLDELAFISRTGRASPAVDRLLGAR